MLSKFFHHCPRKAVCQLPQTFILCPESKSDGSSVMVVKVLELQNNPLAALSFDDFSIMNCIRNGVTYGSLGITKDMRVGYESQFEDLERRFSECESKFFVSSEN